VFNQAAGVVLVVREHQAKSSQLLHVGATLMRGTFDFEPVSTRTLGMGATTSLPTIV